MINYKNSNTRDKSMSLKTFFPKSSWCWLLKKYVLIGETADHLPIRHTRNTIISRSEISRELVRVSNFGKSINWHHVHHMKDYVEIGHLTKYDAFRVLGWTETKLWTLKYGSKSIQTSLILRQRFPISYKLVKFLWFPWYSLKWTNAVIFISASFK